MNNHFDESLDRLAQLLVRHGVNVVRGMYVLLVFDVNHAAKLADRVQFHAYKAGASQVDKLVEDQEKLARDLIVGKTDVPSSYKDAWDKVIEKNGCVIQLRAEASQSMFEPLSKEYRLWELSKNNAKKNFSSIGLQRSQSPWTLTYVPTPESAREIFPLLTEYEAMEKYWDLIFEITYADKVDCLDIWERHLAKLLERRAKLDALKIRSLHFFSQYGTDLHIGLSSKARWLGGVKPTVGGHLFVANIPTYEVFTTPNYRKVSGTVVVTKPIAIHGVLLFQLKLTFQNGALTKVDGDSPTDTFKTFVKADDGASRLGEVALVGLDSPIAKSGKRYGTVLFDENAACHIAFGKAYTAALFGGSSMTKSQLSRIGWNDSIVHQDLMISDVTTSVEATLPSGKKKLLIESGYWLKEFQ